MQVIRPVGREAAVKKYDILSALMAHAHAGDQHRQRLVLRFMSLITTRYNWQHNELTMGQREIARLWCVDERTVKRDMARLRGLGWIQIKRQGVRGRVAILALDLERVMLDTRSAWENIGPDFVERAGGTSATEPADKTVVPFRRGQIEPAEGLWGGACMALQAEDPDLFNAWFAGLTDAGVQDSYLHLIAPTRFQADYIRTHLMGRLRVAVSRMDGSVSGVRVTAG